MDTLKTAPGIISIVDGCAIVLVAGYFYKQTESLKAEVAELRKMIQGIGAATSKIMEGDKARVEAFKIIKDRMEDITNQTSELPHPDYFEALTEDLHTIAVEVEKANNVDIELSTPNPTKHRVSKKSQGRQTSRAKSGSSIKPSKNIKRSHDDDDTEDELLNAVRERS
jgi:hypothetical protein